MLSEKNKILIGRIIGYYALFFLGIKLYAALSQETWKLPNLFLGLILGVISALTFYFIKIQKLSWGWIVFCIVLISAIRYYELPLLAWLDGYVA